MSSSTPTTPPPSASSTFAPAKESDFNRLGIDFRRPIPRPKVRGKVIDFHCHLLAARHAKFWFQAADHFGIDCFLTMSPLDEVMTLQREWGQRVQFIATPKWPDTPPNFIDDYLRRVETFFNIGSRIVKFHAAPGTMVMRGLRLDSPKYKPVFEEIVARKMAVMTHIGDPDTWYAAKYADTAKYGTRADHYAMWESVMSQYPQLPWVGAHLGGNPEDFGRLQSFLDRFPKLMLDCSATRWMAREVSARRDIARDFFIRNQDRILFGSDQVSMDDRGFDFLASRFWVHRKLWETAYTGPNPILDPDLPADQQPVLRGLALPDEVLQKLYHDNAAKFLGRLGVNFADDDSVIKAA